MATDSEGNAVTASGSAASGAGALGRLGVVSGALVGEIGYDDDVDESLRAAVEQASGGELVDGDSDDVFDAVLLWARADDGDLTDALVDVLPLLADDGVVLLATPRPGFDGYVSAAEIADATRTAGLGQPASGQPYGDWAVARITRSKFPAKQRR